ncbi:MAG: hypothetical protein IT242_08715 [Bacteroidia bacterium]|nr:hypothetical protein [Bacteroidia bacterium]
MLSNRRRYTIIFISVLAGSLISFWIVKQRMGTLGPNDYIQLGINFLFAVAIVVGISFFLHRMNKQNTDDGKK